MWEEQMMKLLPWGESVHLISLQFPVFVSREVSIICRKAEGNPRERAHASDPETVLELTSTLYRFHSVLASS